MSASKPGAKEIAERIRKEACFETYFDVGDAEQIISSALEAREQDVQELCDKAEMAADWLHLQGDNRIEDQLRTALAKLRAGEQKGTE